jgi:putative ABC transport system ATP-binding protein
MSEIIRLENVIKMLTGNRRAINGVSLAIQEKERVTICGASGSGKTTLTRLIAGMERPNSGKVFVLDKAVHDMDADTAAVFRSRHIGLIARHPAFMESLTVLENVALPLMIRGIPLAQREKTAQEQLKTLGLAHTVNARPTQLSILEAKLASIARALIAQPQILLLDDAAAGLPERDVEQIKGILYALSQFGECVILEFSGEKNGLICADRTMNLERGKIQEETVQ